MNPSLKRDLLGGVTTFLTLAYLLLVYPKIMVEGGFQPGPTLVAFLITSVVGTLFMGLYADAPFALGPGLSVATYLVYSVIQKGKASPEEALGLVFWGGCIIFFLSVLRIRQLLLIHLPQPIREGSIGAIGLFLVAIGLKGIGILDPALPTLLSIGGLLLFYILHQRKMGSALLLSILALWGLSLFFKMTDWTGISSAPPTLAPSFLSLDLVGALHPSRWSILLSVVLIKLFDTGACLNALTKQAGLHHEGGGIRKIHRIVIPDGATSMVAAILGATNATIFLESAAGIRVGARSGKASVVTALLLLSSLFFYPLVASLPLFAASIALIVVGISMTREYRNIHWREPSEAIPPLLMAIVFLTTMSLYDGFAWGFISYVALKVIANETDKIHKISWILSIVFIAHSILQRIGF